MNDATGETNSEDQPLVLRWRDQSPRSDLPGAQTPGSRRATYPFIKAKTAAARYVEIGVGQSTPLHSSSSDHFIVALEGTVEFDIDGTKYRLEQRDMLFIPANVPYKYSCVGEDSESFFLSVQTVAGSWPPTNWYESGERGSALA